MEVEDTFEVAGWTEWRCGFEVYKDGSILQTMIQLPTVNFQLPQTTDH
jgi:hypothetical protein